MQKISLAALFLFSFFSTFSSTTPDHSTCLNTFIRAAYFKSASTYNTQLLEKTSPDDRNIQQSLQKVDKEIQQHIHTTILHLQACTQNCSLFKIEDGTGSYTNGHYSFTYKLSKPTWLGKLTGYSLSLPKNIEERLECAQTFAQLLIASNYHNLLLKQKEKPSEKITECRNQIKKLEEEFLKCEKKGATVFLPEDIANPLLTELTAELR